MKLILTLTFSALCLFSFSQVKEIMIYAQYEDSLGNQIYAKYGNEKWEKINKDNECLFYVETSVQTKIPISYTNGIDTIRNTLFDCLLDKKQLVVGTKENPLKFKFDYYHKNIKGTVLDTNKKPIRGVHLTYYSSNLKMKAEATTDDKGIYKIERLFKTKNSKYLLDVVKQGYDVFEYNRDPKDGYYHVTLDYITDIIMVDTSARTTKKTSNPTIHSSIPTSEDREKLEKGKADILNLIYYSIGHEINEIIKEREKKGLNSSKIKKELELRYLLEEKYLQIIDINNNLLMATPNSKELRKENQLLEEARKDNNDMIEILENI